MEYVKLNNGLNMPVIGLGTFLSNGDNCKDSVRSAIQSGYRMIDTAEAYGNENQVGEGIKESGISRDKLFLVTKVNFTSYENTKNTVISSLKNLSTDYLDMVLLHWPFGNYYAAWKELEKLYSDGIIKAIGISNFDPDRMVDLINFNNVIPTVNQIETHLYCQRHKDAIWMKKYNVSHMAYAPLGQGKQNTMFSHPEITEIAEKYNKTPSQILLRFFTQQNIIVIPKSENIEHIRSNIEIFDFNLTNEEIESLKTFDLNEPMVGKAEDPSFVELAMTW